MSELRAMLDITSRHIGTDAVQTVNARDLHTFLEVKTAFKDWIARRIADYGFTDGLDFCSFLSESSGGRPANEYALSLDMAKELAMVERNDKGKQARQYFIECERRAKAAPAALIPQSLPEALRLAADLAEQKAQAEAALAIAAPKAEALDLISAGDDALTITQAAKVLGVKREKLTNWLHANGWSYRQNGSWLAKQTQIENGRLQYKEARYTDEKTGQECIKPYFHIMPKGLAKLATVFAIKEAA